MDKQVMAILELLLSEYEYITYSYISDRLDISVRTVARHIKSLEGYFHNHRIQVDTRRGEGIRLILPDEERTKLKKLVNKNDSSGLPAVERKIVLICELLGLQEPAKSYYFSSALKISLGTVGRDLEEIEPWFSQQGLVLVRCRGNGLFVTGAEKAFRDAIVNLLISHIDTRNIHYSYIEFMGPDFFKKELSRYTKIKLAGLMDGHLLENIKKIVDNYDKNIKETLVDESYFKLILLLGLMVQRQEKELVLDRENVQAVKNFAQYDYIIKLLRVIEKYYNLTLRDCDVYNILIHFVAARRRQGLALEQSQDDSQLAELAYKIINNIQQELQVKLDYDKDLLKRLLDHLKLLMIRASMEVKVTNNFLEPIKTDYRHIFDVVKKHIAFLEEVIGKPVSDEEVGYITIHFAASLVALENNAKSIRAIVICMSGIGTSKILVEKIKQEVKPVNIVATISSHAINEIELSEQGIDLIISSVKIETFILPVVVVNPLLREEDKLRLNRKINEIEERKNIVSITKRVTDKAVQTKQPETGGKDTGYYLALIHRLLEHFYYQDQLVVKTKQELIGHIARTLVDTEVLQATILRNLLKREEYGSTVIDEKGLVLLHCRAGDCLRVGIARLAVPVNDLTNDPPAKIHTAFIVVLPQEDDDRIVEMVSQISKALIVDKTFLYEVCDGNKEIAVESISRILFNFIS